MPLFLDAADLLHIDDRNAWLRHHGTRDWWEETIARLRSVEVDAHTFMQQLHQIRSINGVRDMIRHFASQGFVGDVDIRSLIPVIVPIDYHLPNEVQDIVLQTFAGIEHAREINVRADIFRIPDADQRNRSGGNTIPSVISINRVGRSNVPNADVSISRHSRRSHIREHADHEMREAGVDTYPRINHPDILENFPRTSIRREMQADDTSVGTIETTVPEE